MSRPPPLDRTTNAEYGLKFAGAAISSMAASTVTNPVDIIKVRQQLTITQAAVLGPSNAFWSVAAGMASREGPLSLWKGLTASMLRELVYSGIRLGSYEYFKTSFLELSRGSLKSDGLGLKVLAATAAASIGAAVANPTDLVKVRMQAYHPTGSPYRSTRDAFLTTYKEGQGSVSAGVRSLYRGVTATTIRGIVLSTSQICAYDQVKQSIKARGLMQEGFPLHFTASMWAGFFCSVTSNPVDVIKVRLMNDKTGQFESILGCVKHILRTEGPIAFWKGFSMCWARLGVHTVVTFLVFEKFRQLVGLRAL